MKDVTFILLASGSSTRFGATTNKVYLDYLGKPLINHTLDKLAALNDIKEIIITYRREDAALLEKALEGLDLNVIKVLGGATRSLSLNNALKHATGTKILVHDGARCKTNIVDIKRVIDALDENIVVSLYHPSIDAIKTKNESIKKSDAYLVTTPQGFRSEYLEFVKSADINRDDDLEPFIKAKIPVCYLLETTPNPKVTYKKDLTEEAYLVGHSFDFHPLVKDRPLYLGGLLIPSPVGLLGHSDADVVLHAICEALLGAMNEGDLGDNYSDQDKAYKDISSTYFVEDVKKRLNNKKRIIVNIDCEIYLEEPKLKDWKEEIAQNIAKLFSINRSQVSIKATTLEKQGVIGLSKGIASSAYVLIKKDE